MDLVKINHEDYGLTEKKAKEVSSVFLPMLEAMEKLEEEFNSIVELEMNEETVIKAKALRHKYVKIRTETAKIHKGVKSFYLLGGKFVDGWKNAQLMASHGKEEKLKEIENYFENQEKARLAKIQDERAKILINFEIEIIPPDLCLMPNDVWSNYLVGIENNYKLKKEAERKAEEDRIRKEKEDEEERKRIQEENKRLKAEAEKREKEEQARLEKERIEREKREKEEQARLEAEAKEREERERKERERLEKERIEKEKIQAKLKKEQEERERIQAELKKKEEQERIEKEKLEKEKLEREQAELKKGDSEKLNDLIKDLQALKIKYIFQASDYKDMQLRINDLLDKIVIYIKQNS